MDWSTERAGADLDDHLASCEVCSGVVASSNISYPEIHLMEQLCDRGKTLTTEWLNKLEEGCQDHVRPS